MGHFTDPDIKKILDTPANGNNSKKATSRPIAIHLEHQTDMWSDKIPFFYHHGKMCAYILNGPSWHKTSENTQYISGLIDENSYEFEPISQYIRHPDVKLITISSSYCKPVETDIKTVANDASLAGSTILKAAGNAGRCWAWQRERETITSHYFMPGFIRVGEAKANGKVMGSSQASGPAFICIHPFHSDEEIAFPYNPTTEEIKNFRKWALDKGMKSGYNLINRIKAYFVGGKETGAHKGTSFAAPHAGAMIMRHSAGFDGIEPYDIIPAALLAAQKNFPKKKPHIRNAAGICFSEGSSGGGLLKEKALKKSLKKIWDIHAHNVKTEGQSFSQPITEITENDAPILEEGKKLKIQTDKVKGKLVNVALSIVFKKEGDNHLGTGGVPQYVKLTSPSGTCVNLPLLIDRQKKYHKTIRAGFSTTAFFGEASNAKKGIWTVSYLENADKNMFEMESAQLVTHSLHPKSPGAKLLNKFIPDADGPGLNKKPKKWKELPWPQIVTAYPVWK